MSTAQRKILDGVLDDLSGWRRDGEELDRDDVPDLVTIMPERFYHPEDLYDESTPDKWAMKNGYVHENERR